MQIKPITVNAASLAPERGMQGRDLTAQAQAGDGGFGPECRVTISKEGRNLSRQKRETREERSVQSTRPERRLIRDQEEAERDKSIKDSYREQLDEIDKKIDALNSSYATKKHKDETIEKQQEVLRAMRNLKAFQEEQNQRQVKEARQMAMQSAEYQNKIDENNRDLLTLLRTMKEAEKAEEEREGGAAADGSSGASAPGTIGSASDVINNSADHYMMSSIKREWGVQEAIAGLADTGHGRLKQADAIAKDILNQTKDIRLALDDSSFTDEELAEMMKRLQDGTTKSGLAEEFGRRGWKRGMQLNYDDVENYRGWGLQNLHDAWEAKVQHLGESLSVAQETKEDMMLSSVDATLGEARQDSLDKASRELADEVRELIDEREDVNKTPQEKEEDEKEIES